MWLRISKDTLINTDMITLVKVIDEDSIPKLLINIGEIQYLYEGNAEGTLKKITYENDKQFWAGR